ncbi:MAG: inositol monophosphatase family protein, partial [Pseudomonadota bacterium]
AAEITPRFRNLRPDETREKGPNDPVTAADEAMERRLTETLPSFLDADVLGEEAASADPEKLDRLRDPAPLWIVDPVDGTANFDAGRTPFAVIVALCAGDHVAAAWIHDPIASETITAQPRAGAWRNGVRLTPREAPAEWIGSISTKHMAPDARAWADRVRARHPHNRSLFCAGAEYAALAKGERQYSLFHRLLPWDHAAGALIVTEAGGKVAIAPDGESYRPSRLRGLLLSAATPALWDAIVASAD